MNGLNSYAEKNSEWDRWVALHMNGGRINNINREAIVATPGQIADPVKEGNTLLLW